MFVNALVTKVARDHQEPDRDFRRRRVIAALTLCAGGLLLGLSFSVRPADPAFYPLTFGLAAVWVAGGLISGPLHLGYSRTRGRMRRPVLIPVLTGLAVVVVFVAGALVVRDIAPLHRLVDSVLAHAREGSAPLVAVITLVNGIAEEIFFRGGLYAAIGVRQPVLISTLVYTAVTLASGNIMLVFAAVTLGFVLGLQRRASGGILAPILTHITWSMSMFLLLPPIFAAA
ncbi:CPBP family intramembrane glutamic endopeptidase [Nakamurella endophytica]|uniref:CPBP family intramembrane glutamic endopeptidase n=1 Tax=Nakamurella endophytica TaxID=1748367 RepID=UPI003570AF00